MGAPKVIRYLLDSNIISYWLDGSDRVLIQRIKEKRAWSALSSVVLHELYFGAYKGSKQRQTLALYDQIEFAILPFERDDARTAGELRAALRRAGTPIGPYDILIAGHALARDLTLVTNNTREFARVEGLKHEDWTAA